MGWADTARRERKAVGGSGKGPVGRAAPDKDILDMVRQPCGGIANRGLVEALRSNPGGVMELELWAPMRSACCGSATGGRPLSGAWRTMEVSMEHSKVLLAAFVSHAAMNSPGSAIDPKEARKANVTRVTITSSLHGEDIPVIDDRHACLLKGHSAHARPFAPFSLSWF